jgi:hypothetical protein
VDSRHPEATCSGMSDIWFVRPQTAAGGEYTGGIGCDRREKRLCYSPLAGRGKSGDRVRCDDTARHHTEEKKRPSALKLPLTRVNAMPKQKDQLNPRPDRRDWRHFE